MPDAEAPTANDAPAPETETPTTPPTPTEEASKPEPKTFDEVYVKQLRSEAAKYRSEAKTAAEELEKLRVAAMSEQERAIAEARIEGRTLALHELGSRLVDAEIRAAASGRLKDGQMRILLQGLNRSAFLTDDGAVDEKAVREFVNGIAPAPAEPQGPPPDPRFPDFGQGQRGPSPAANDDSLLRALEEISGRR